MLQDGPPPGGFPSIRYARRIPSTGPTGFTLFAVGTAVMAYGFYKVCLPGPAHRPDCHFRTSCYSGVTLRYCLCDGLCDRVAPLCRWQTPPACGAEEVPGPCAGGRGQQAAASHQGGEAGDAHGHLPGAAGRGGPEVRPDSAWGRHVRNILAPGVYLKEAGARGSAACCAGMCTPRRG